MMAQRLQKMHDISPEERDLLVRLGRTIDGAVNNRGPTNPGSDGQVRIGRANPKLPPPTNITEERGIQSVKIQWDAVDSPILANYQLIFQRLTDGSSVTKLAYEPQLVFKGASGDYNVFISSVARDGTRSQQRKFTTTLLDNVMLLEGAKNTVDSASFTVSETIYVPKGYTVFAWAAFTIDDHAFQGNNVIPKVVLKRSTIPNDITSAATVQEITLYPQSETATSWEVNTGLTSGAITRPTGIGAPADNGNTETSQTIMFTPLVLDDIDTAQDHTFYLSVEDRITKDLRGLSIVLWVATGGRGFDVGVDFETHLVSLASGVGGLQFEDSSIASVGNEWGDPEFSISYWFKPNDHNVIFPLDIRYANTATNVSLLASITALTAPNRANFGFTIGQGDLGLPGDFTSRSVTYNQTPVSSDLDGTIMPGGIKSWTHHVITYEASGPRRVRLYVNGSLAISSDAGDSVLAWASDAITTGTQNCKPDGTMRTIKVPEWGAILSSPSIRFWETAIWSDLLSAAEISEIYNNGDGWERNMTVNQGSYASSGDLQIYWKFGQNKSNSDLTIGGTTTTDNLTTVWSGDDLTATGIDVVDDYPGK